MLGGYLRNYSYQRLAIKVIKKEYFMKLFAKIAQVGNILGTAYRLTLTFDTEKAELNQSI